MIIYLPVHNDTKEVDYAYVEYALTEIPTEEHYSLVENYEYKPFKIIPVAGRNGMRKKIENE